MARIYILCKLQTGKMISQKVFRILLLYNMLEIVYKVVQAGNGRTHDFIHVDDLHYLISGDSMEVKEFYREEDNSAVSFTDLKEENLNAYASPIIFHPPLLHLHSLPIGMPHMEHVIVQNLSPDTSIQMLSISGNTPHTHCSFFEDKVIPPGGNTSFDVILLTVDVGQIQDTLFIHTSLGSFKFQVSAVGVPNPYRLRPFLGVKMPLNSTYSPVIYMHNPHSTAIQVTEIYSSGGDLHLEIPGDKGETSKTLWEIQPYETKKVIKANFIARIEKNHTAYIRIRTNSDDEYFLLPLEVTVTSDPDIYSATETLNFGILRSQDEPKVLTLSLINSGTKHVSISNVITTPVNEAVDIKFTSIKVPPDTVFSTQVATITFDPSRALHQKQCCGKIVIKSKNNQHKLQIPYEAQLIQGFLDYNKNSTRFYVGIQNNTNDREFNITNNFSVVIVVYNVSLPEEAKTHFLVHMTAPVILQPGETKTVAFISFTPSIPVLQDSYFRLHTNISHFDIPLISFTGRLKVFLPHAVNESFVNFGTLKVGDKHTAVFAVINENPVDVNLKFWGSNSSKTYVELVGIDKGNASTLAWRQNFSGMARSLTLKPQHYVIFRIGVTAPNYEGMFRGQAFVETEYERIHIPFSLRTAKGSLSVDEIYFENSFPGKISTQSLYVRSTFTHPVTVTGIYTIPEDSRFVFHPLKNRTPVLQPNTKNMIGKIHFDHRKLCKQRCYSGLPTTTPLGHQWLLGMALPTDICEMDGELLRILNRRWINLLDLDEKVTNISLRIDTTEVRGYILKVHSSLQWPRVISNYRVKFPVTQVGNYTIKDFALENPSSLPVLVQVVTLSWYPNSDNIINVLRERYGDASAENNIIKDSEDFTLEDLENEQNPESHIPAYRKSLEEFFGIKSHNKSIVMLLTPGMRVRIQVRFTPLDDTLKSSIILIRNNLTILDTVFIHGRGGYGQIKFGNISPGRDSTLIFELTERHLKDCESSKSSTEPHPNLNVRRTFTVRNTGALTIYIRSFDINGKSCEGFGFKVLNCYAFELKPNSTKKIDIAYTPDFSLTHVERTLNIWINAGQVLQYKIVATVPRHLLTFCSDALPRPSWEYYVYFIFVGLSLATIFTAIVCGYLDSKRILHYTFYPFITVGNYAEKMDDLNVFDLNALCTANNENRNDDLQDETEKQKGQHPTTKYVSRSGSILNSIKNSITSSPNRKVLPHSKEFEDIMNDFNRHMKKKTPKRQNQDNSCVESNLLEIKKSQSRNSWTRFLKPPFSFNSCSNVNNKPSVGTQTASDCAENNLQQTLKEVGVRNDQIVNDFIIIENNERCKTKNKNENKYNDFNNYIKKINDIFPERDNEDHTADISLVSNIIEKTHPLPDTYATKPQNTRCINRKIKERGNKVIRPILNSLNDDRNESVSKNKVHKKINDAAFKAFCEKSSLELPYKPKKSISDDVSGSCETIFTDDSSSTVSGSLETFDSNTENWCPMCPPTPENVKVHCMFPPDIWNSEKVSQYNSSDINDNLLGSKLKHWVLQSGPDFSLDSTSNSLKDAYNATINNSNKTDNDLKNSAWNNSQVTLEQALQTERNMRYETCKKQVGEYSNWPGFDLTPVRESLWDTNYNPTGCSWTKKIEDSNTQDFSPNEERNESPVTAWVADVATGTPCDNSSPICSMSVNDDKNVCSNDNLHNDKDFMDGEFNLFHTPSALWIPQISETKENLLCPYKSSAWSFSLFSDPSQDPLVEVSDVSVENSEKASKTSD